MDGTMRCHHCGDVIGAYEPLIVLTEGAVRRTSRAAAQAGGQRLGECYHSACYSQVHEEDRLPE